MTVDFGKGSMWPNRMEGFTNARYNDGIFVFIPYRVGPDGRIQMDVDCCLEWILRIRVFFSLFSNLFFRQNVGDEFRFYLSPILSHCSCLSPF